MIGTAHISEESANLVRRTIKTVKPDVVMIELDPKRIGRVVGSNQTLEEAGTKSTNSCCCYTVLYCTVLREIKNLMMITNCRVRFACWI